MTVELSRRLLALGVPSAEIEAALFLSVARGVALPRALIDRGVLTERALEEELTRAQGFAVEQVAASPELSLRLPASMCRRLGAVPTRFDPVSNAAEVAAMDAMDPHIAAEFSFHLGLDVRVVRATMNAIEAAVRRLELGESDGGPARSRRRTPAFPHGAPRSTAPPPPVEDVPIPLVRKVGGQLIDVDRSSGAIPPPSARTTDRHGLAPATLRHEPRLLTGPTHDPAPSVSFPSAPPPGMLDGSALHLPPLPTLPPDTVVPDTEEWGPASDSFHAGFVGLAVSPSARPPAAAVDSADVAAAIPETREEEEQGGEEEELPPPDSVEPESKTNVYQRPSATEVLSPALDRLSVAETRDDLIATLIDVASLIAARVAVFVVKRDGFHGWSCNASFGDATAVRKVVIPHSAPNILATATAAGFYLGPVPSTPGHAALLAVMGRVGPEVAVHVAKVSGKPAVLLIADGLEDTMLGTRALGEMARVAGLTLGRILTLR